MNKEENEFLVKLGKYLLDNNSVDSVSTTNNIRYLVSSKVLFKGMGYCRSIYNNRVAATSYYNELLKEGYEDVIISQIIEKL